MKEITYTLVPAKECNMCQSDVSNSKLLGRRLNGSQGKAPTKRVGFSVSIMKCNNCGLIYPNPLPVPSSIDDHYGIPPETYWTDAYIDVDENYYSGVIRILEKLTPIEKGMKALDIGAGLGNCIVALDRAGFDTYGIEPSSSFYKRTKENYNFSDEKLQNKSVEEADFPENTFDFVTFGAVLEHLYDPFEALKSALKWAKKGGLIAIEVPSSDWIIAKLVNRMYKLKGTDYVANLSPMHEPYHIYEFTAKSFEKAAKLLNFEIAYQEYFPGETYGPNIVKKILKPMVKGDKGMQLFVMLRKL